MDSGNSGSLQSSSGDEQEYDSSRADQFSNFFNTNPLSSESIPTLHHQPITPFHLPSSSTHYLNMNAMNHDPLNLISREQSPQLPPYPSFEHQGPTINRFRPLRPASSAPEHHQLGVMNKNSLHNPKKRTRASRRAPTTVLTTDTSNFRAMVQEFTGIPRAPPFSTNHKFPSRGRLDLFGPSGRTFGSLFPFKPQKVQSVTPHSSLSSSSLLNHSVTVDGDNSGGNMNNAISSTGTMMGGTANPISNYNHLALHPDLGLNKSQPLNVLINEQNNNGQTQASASTSSLQSLLLLYPDHRNQHRDHDPLDELRHVNANHGGLRENDSNNQAGDSTGFRSFNDLRRN